MKRKYFFTFIILFSIFLLTPIANAATYYVDQNHPQASDENPGTEDLPWKTLKKACNTVEAGDTVIVKAGRYFEPNPETALWYCVMNVAKSGTSDNPIIFKSHPLHAAVVVSNGWPAWAIYQKEYIIVDGFKIEGQFRFQNCNHCTIRNCDISVGWYPEGDPSMNFGLMICASHNCVIENNYIHDIADSGNHNDNTRCVMIFGDSTNNIFQNNLADAAPGYVYAAFGHKGGGTHNNIWRYNIAKNAKVGFYGKGSTTPDYWADNNIYYQNLVINCETAFKVSYNCRGWQIYNNVAYKCREFLGAWQENNQNYSVWNNIIVLTDDGNWEAPQTCYYLTDPLPENFFAYSDYNNFRVTSICIYHYDTYATTLNDWRAKTPFDDHSIESDPLFVNPEAHDFHLRPNSPCLNAGIDRQDYDGDGDTTERINMGCYITGDEIIGPILNQGPQMSNESPARNATDVPRNTNISFDITDSDGVNQSSISVSVNGNNVTSSCTITVISNGFHILYDPPEDFDYRQDVTVLVTATDGLGNTTNDSWSFKIKQLSDVIEFDASLNGSSVKLSWEVPDDPDYAGVEM